MLSFYGKWVIGFFYGILIGVFFLLMGGSWFEMYWLVILGLVVYFWVLWFECFKCVVLMMEFVVVYFVVFLVCVFSWYFDLGMNILLMILFLVIIFVFGFVFIMGLVELLLCNMVLGMVWVMDVLMQLFKLYFGVYLGVVIGFSVFGENIYNFVVLLFYWLIWLVVIVLCFGLVVIFKICFKYILWVLVFVLLVYSSIVLVFDYLF